MKYWVSIAAAGACVIAAFGMAVAVKAGNNFAAELLLHHNLERKRLGVPQLAWSQKLAQDSKRWADRLAQIDRMEHASQAERGGAGENLWMGSAGMYSASDMVQGFIDERRDFRRGKFPNISRTGNWRDVGHYTQVIWRDTQQVGCAVSRGRTHDFLVCRYWPAGNVYGAEI